ncbi:MAG: RidA family protein [Pseudomonadota bacterium]
MSRESIQPSGLLDGRAFAMAQVVRSKGGSYVHISGQTAIDETGAHIGSDLATQLGAALENVRRALAGVGATPSDLVSVTTYIVDFTPEQLADYVPALNSFFDPENLPACSMLGISALAQPGLLVEIEAVAVLDD